MNDDSENPNNIVKLCADCSDKRKHDFQDKLKKGDIEICIGDYCKICFEHKEHMWVRVEKKLKGDKYSGKLDNVPVFVKSVKLGDKVDFSRKDIEDLMLQER